MAIARFHVLDTAEVTSSQLIFFVNVISRAYSREATNLRSVALNTVHLWIICIDLFLTPYQSAVALPPMASVVKDCRETTLFPEGIWMQFQQRVGDQLWREQGVNGSSLIGRNSSERNNDLL